MVWLRVPLTIDARVLRPRGFGLVHANPVLVLLLLALLVVIIVLVRNNRR